MCNYECDYGKANNIQTGERAKIGDTPVNTRSGTMFRQRKSPGVCDGSAAFCHNRSSLSVANFACCKCAERTSPALPGLRAFCRAHAPRPLTPVRLGPSAPSPKSPSKRVTGPPSVEASRRLVRPIRCTRAACAPQSFVSAKVSTLNASRLRCAACERGLSNAK
jgi:hypothetical protein